MAYQVILNPLVAGSNPARVSQEIAEMILIEVPQIVTPVTWLSAPELLTIPQASQLSGLPEETLWAMIGERVVDASESANGCLVDKNSLELALEAAAELLRWDD